ncbi:hypothetical protein [Pseudooceanicola sp.]|uniref:hypothetical protein n=1 Tax=Pseudooceanicola sp. TaxID=1914328 RepID=UPI0035C74CBF
MLDATGQDGLASVLGYDIANGGVGDDRLSGGSGQDTLFGSADDQILVDGDQSPHDAVAPATPAPMPPPGFTRDLVANMQALFANDELDFSPAHIGRAPQQRRFAGA